MTIDVTSSNTNEGTVAPSSLTFSSDDWNTEKTIAVTGVDDQDRDDSVPYEITLKVTSDAADDPYGKLQSITISATNLDDEDVLRSWWTGDATVRDVLGPNNGTLMARHSRRMS